MYRFIFQYLNEEHHVLHYWYTAWPDHKAPDTARTLLEMVKEVEQQRANPTSNPHKGPVVVHCRLGINTSCGQMAEHCTWNGENNTT